MPRPLDSQAIDTNVTGDFTSRFVMDDRTAYGVTRSGIVATSLTTGKPRWTQDFPGAGSDASDPSLNDSADVSAPVLSPDHSTVYGVLDVELRGGGTESDSQAYQLIAVDTGSGKLDWSVNIPGVGLAYGAPTGGLTILSATDGRVIVGDGGGNSMSDGIVAAVDAATHKVLWTTRGDAYAVTPSAIVATAHSTTTAKTDYPLLVGLDPTSGKVKWTAGNDYESAPRDLSVLQTDSKTVVSFAHYSGASGTVTAAIDPTTGALTQRFPGVELSHPTRDGDAVYDVGVNDDGADELRALDPSTLQPIWSLPEANRMAPRDPVFFDGLVYGQVDHGMSVVLDGATGRDVTANIQGSFAMVNNVGAIMFSDDGKTAFVPATG
ncbi:hypothetical protein GCM10027169_03060 [Gordonia jinhuaensis]|uniref:Pyrrolo-quinoline quinone repeat domain-containing protein n=1 Tax=Gordonia jinhuaensis TaxID=1517702 RepID=A0A916T4T6_9ACTN|nr:hypothetical protein GCM10011489_16600 [Gordonia jinhuaensis]